MDVILLVSKTIGLGLLGLIVLLVLAALIFGDRIVKKWEYEAEFFNEKGREFGELDIEMSRIEKKEPQFSLKASFRMRHESLALHSTVKIYLDQLLVLEGKVKEAGRILLTNEDLQSEIEEPKTGQLCRVVCGGQQLFSQELVPD